MPREAVSPRAGFLSGYTAAVFSSSLGTGAGFFLLSPGSTLRVKLQLSLVFPKMCVLPARDTEPAQAHSGLLAERQFCQTPLDTFQGQHESGSSTDPCME